MLTRRRHRCQEYVWETGWIQKSVSRGKRSSHFCYVYLNKLVHVVVLIFYSKKSYDPIGHYGVVDYSHSHTDLDRFMSNSRVHNLLNSVIHPSFYSFRYLQTAKKQSAFMRDRPMSPLQTAIYWVEFVCRHKGARHLRVAGTDLPWYQYFLVDVALFLLLGTLVTSIVIYFICRKICCLKSKQKVKKN